MPAGMYTAVSDNDVLLTNVTGVKGRRMVANN